ncbi:DNA polymerase III subunit beta [Nitrococcus mobilis]|uniref:Beta sliding clamp n=1 Tax=Nitrococcus mobilis Nb-231 TaxID=314278 RepID=A4BTW2_9GAMM|nr:DNA polymerase III subunit beta [Nitrococcus mobilis]EAR20783.1 DNA polymerase III subunit beta [Nitrococcus mobilis Nb-231]
MEFDVERTALLKALQSIIGVVERRQTLPILANILLDAREQRLAITATDLEVEIQAHAQAELSQAGETTLPARKLMDIVRNLPEHADIHVSTSHDRIALQLPHSRFTLATLPTKDFPTVEEIGQTQDLELTQSHLRWLIDRTGFAMALQDVRYYLNGLLLELEPYCLRAVATDGHRLALAEVVTELPLTETKQVIVPRKGIQELLRLLTDSDEPLRLELGDNHIRVTWPEVRFTTKLLDGQFPSYQRVIPKQNGGCLQVERHTLRQALIRAAILSNEHLHGVRFILGGTSLRICSNNPAQEEAEEELTAAYDGEAFEIGFNASYLLDALAAIEESTVEIFLTNANSSALLRGAGNERCRYVVMPLRL